MSFLSSPRKRTIAWIYFANLLLSFHYYLIIYINSSFLENFFGKQGLGLLYVAGSIVSIVFFLEAPRMLRRFGNWRYILVAIFLEFLAVLGLAFAGDAFTAGWLFILHQMLISMILFNLDVFLEEVTKEEGHTGQLRGTYLTLSNITLVISPAITGFILSGNNFSLVYLLSALICIPLFAVAWKDLAIPDKRITHTRLGDTFKEIFANKNIKNVTLTQLVLQFFYAWMVIYMPLYLNKTIGFSWEELGVLFSIILLPFVLFELPVGWLADKKFGEKRFMIAGLIIIVLTMGLVPFLIEKTFILWAILLFISRTGASFVEVANESYFFKHVGAQDANIISFFRMMRPLSYILTPLVVTLALGLVSLRLSYFVLAFIVLWGLVFTKKLRENR